MNKDNGRRTAAARWRLGTVTLATMVMGSAVRADVLLVPDEFPTIQEAVEAAATGDIVLIGPGVFAEVVTVQRKAISLQSVAGSERTIIDGLERGTVLSILDAPGEVHIVGLTLRNGRGSCRGGGVLALGSPVLVSGCTIESNVAACPEGLMSAGTGRGGGVYTDGSIVIIDSIVRDNLAFGTPIVDNEFGGDLVGSPAFGGGIWAGNTVTITDSHVIDNTAQGGCCCFSNAGGGGISASAVVGVRSTFNGNRALQGGGCLGINAGSGGAIDAGSVTLDWCRVQDNEAVGASAYGGGINGSCVLRNSLITGNVADAYLAGAPWAHGGGIGGSSVVAQGCTIVENYSTDAGSAISTTGPQGSGPFLIENCIIWGNFASKPAGQLELPATASVAFCLVEGGYDGASILSGDPLFLDSEAGDYRLDAESPCVDSGDPDAQADLPRTDLDGLPRFAFASCAGVLPGAKPTMDMGCHERQNTDPVPGDLDHNCIVGGEDLGLLLGAWGSDDSSADIDGDGIVDGVDLGLLLAQWSS